MRGQNAIGLYGRIKRVLSVGQPENGSIAALPASRVRLFVQFSKQAEIRLTK